MGKIILKNFEKTIALFSKMCIIIIVSKIYQIKKGTTW